jgi:hypothetical protein
MSSRIHNSILMFDIGVSIFGLLIVLMLVFNPPISQESLFWQKPLVGLVFSLICILGILAALFPRLCSQTFHFQKESSGLASRRISVTSHHPNCAEFSAHIIRINSHTLCAACTGLLLGAITALVGTALYFFGGWHLQGTGFPVVLIGVTATILGFLQLKLRGFARLTLNIFFVLGAFLILVGIDELTGSLLIDIFLETFIVFWILTRIQLSQWDHWRICSRCKSPCEFGE